MRMIIIIKKLYCYLILFIGLIYMKLILPVFFWAEFTCTPTRITFLPGNKKICILLNIIVTFHSQTG